MRTWRRFYRRHRIAVTAAAIGVAALVLVGRVPLMPNADALFTPVSGVSTLVASPVAGGALLFRQRSRKAIRWYALAMLAGATAPMLYGYFHNILPDTPMPSTVGDVVAMLSSFAPALLFVGGALLGYWLARRRWQVHKEKEMRPGRRGSKAGPHREGRRREDIQFSTNLAAGDYMVPTPLLAFL